MIQVILILGICLIVGSLIGMRMYLKHQESKRRFENEINDINRTSTSN